MRDTGCGRVQAITGWGQWGQDGVAKEKDPRKPYANFMGRLKCKLKIVKREIFYMTG